MSEEEVVWNQYFTETGVPYYINSVTQESRWDDPSALNFEQVQDPSLTETDQEAEHVTTDPVHTLQDASLVTNNAVVGPESLVDDTLMTEQLVPAVPHVEPETNDLGAPLIPFLIVSSHMTSVIMLSSRLPFFFG